MHNAPSSPERELSKITSLEELIHDLSMVSDERRGAAQSVLWNLEMILGDMASANYSKDGNFQYPSRIATVAASMLPALNAVYGVYDEYRIAGSDNVLARILENLLGIELLAAPRKPLNEEARRKNWSTIHRALGMHQTSDESVGELQSEISDRTNKLV
jgi:hypothetical protein